jgi:hypothetical protein
MTRILTAHWTDVASGNGRELTLSRQATGGVRVLVLGDGVVLVDYTLTDAIFAEFEPAIREGLRTLGARIDDPAATEDAIRLLRAAREKVGLVEGKPLAGAIFHLLGGQR